MQPREYGPLTADKTSYGSHSRADTRRRRGRRAVRREAAIELEARRHTAIPVEIQGDDPALGLPEYAVVTDQAIGAHQDVVLVAQSMSTARWGRVRFPRAWPVCVLLLAWASTVSPNTTVEPAPRRADQLRQVVVCGRTASSSRFHGRTITVPVMPWTSCSAQM